MHMGNMKHVAASQTSPSKHWCCDTISDIPTKDKDEPLYRVEDERLATSLLLRKQNSSSSDEVVSYKTGGQPQMYMYACSKVAETSLKVNGTKEKQSHGASQKCNDRS